MQQVANWDKATVFDIEADALLDDATKIHVLSFKLYGKDVSSIAGSNTERIKAFFQYHIDNSIPVIAHNGKAYDVPLVQKLLGIDLSSLMVIDTLALSWYLNFDRQKHGLDSFHADYGIEKPKIDDWENLTYEEYRHRCEEDVKINSALWEDLKSRLVDMYSITQSEIDSGNVGGKRVSEEEVIYIDKFLGSSVDSAVDRVLSYLMFKMDCLALQESTGWCVDIEMLDTALDEMQKEADVAREELESVMPLVPKYSVKKKPAKPFKKDGTLSTSGEEWERLYAILKSGECDEHGNPLAIKIEGSQDIKILKSYENPNANSSAQIKAFLFSKGWVPQTFKYERDEEEFNKWIKKKPRKGSHYSSWDDWKNSKPVDREIPQITITGDNGKELCHSLVELSEQVPEIKVYARYNVLKHRISILEGFRNGMRNGKLKARAAGFTNTLRMKHAEIVNLPGVDKPYGKIVRGVLVAGKGMTSVGSDLSSLEDRVKHHFMLSHDPEYVKTMQSPDFDSHILMALAAGMITQKEFDDFKAGIKPPHVVKARKQGKSTNYASVYSAAPATIARAAGVSLKEGEKLHEGYWKLNWAVKAIADEQVVIRDSRGSKWLINPINGFCYSLRKDSDRFSTLCQGTGAFFFDMWLCYCLEGMQEKWGKKTLTGQFHDEHIFVIRDTENSKQAFAQLIQDSIEKVNRTFMLRRDLGCETQFGYRYSDIH